MNKQVAQYVRLFGKWWWLFLISVVIPAVISYHFASKQPDLYEAKVTLMVGTSLESANPDPTLMTTSNYLAQAYARLVTYDPVTEAVVERLGLDRSPGELASQITPFIYPEASLLEILVVDTNPQAAPLIANALAEELIARTPVADAVAQAEATFVLEQLEDVKDKIQKVQEDVREARASLVDLKSAAEIQEVQDRITKLEEVLGMYRALYSNLLRSYAGGSPNILQIFEPAVEPHRPIARQTLLFVAIAGVAGLGLAVGAVFLIEYLDDAVRWEGEAKQTLLSMPVLGAIPKMPNGKGATIDAISPSAEMVRTLRTNVHLAAGSQGLGSLLITSPEARTGKTLSVAQLGLVLATGGRRVVMVDADLRKPALHELFDLPNLFGLSELLASYTPITGSSWPKGVQETEVEGLYLLPGGRPLFDPGWRLTSPRLGELFEALKEQADVILIDSPPGSVAADAVVLASAADGTVMVVGTGTSRRKKILEIKDRLTRQDEVNLLGVVFNRVKIESDSYHRYGMTHGRFGRLWDRLRARLPFGGGGVAQDGQVILTLAEMAHYLGVSKATARRWCKDGRLPAFKTWFQWRVKWKDLQTAAERMVRS